MAAHRARLIASSTAATTVALALAAGGSETAVPSTADADAEVKKRPNVAVEKCSTRSQAAFPGAFTDRRNLVVGPLAMIGAGRGRVPFFPDFGSDAGGQKFQLLVRNGHQVTLELSRRTRREAALVYGPLGGGQVSLDRAHRVVKFIACRRGEPSGSSADGRPVTFWSGGVAASSPRCVPLRIFVDGRKAPRREVIHLGVRRCRDANWGREREVALRGPLECGSDRAGSKHALRDFVATLRRGKQREILSVLAATGRFEWISVTNAHGRDMSIVDDRRRAARTIARRGGLPIRITEFQNAERPHRTTDLGFEGTWRGGRELTGKGCPGLRRR